jgi:outer membrane biosynthesis protein TonB
VSFFFGVKRKKMNDEPMNFVLRNEEDGDVFDAASDTLCDNPVEQDVLEEVQLEFLPENPVSDDEAKTKKTEIDDDAKKKKKSEEPKKKKKKSEEPKKKKKTSEEPKKKKKKSEEPKKKKKKSEEPKKKKKKKESDDDNEVKTKKASSGVKRLMSKVVMAKLLEEHGSTPTPEMVSLLCKDVDAKVAISIRQAQCLSGKKRLRAVDIDKYAIAPLVMTM